MEAIKEGTEGGYTVEVLLSQWSDQTDLISSKPHKTH